MDLKFFLISLFCLLSLPTQAQDARTFSLWVDQFSQEAIARGISQSTLQSAVPLMMYDQSVIDLDRKQPESKVTFAHYLKNTLPKSRITQARELLSDNLADLNFLEMKTGVPSTIIVALWGIESNFGQNMGDNDVLTSLATLAYEGRRAAFFKEELIQALAIIQEEGLRPETLKGSWAGAMGQCQFMPSTYRRFAIDYYRDGSKDIWNDTGDALASIANYLSAEGWTPGMRWGGAVKVSRSVPQDQVGLAVKKSLRAWRALGVIPLSDKDSTLPSLGLSLIQPDGSSGRSYLVTENFRALMRWNRSTYFATTVGLFADQIGSD
ncbi:MAG: lytic murein transglycosylase [Alphaproteobacteria bacterium]|nr:lytic murein transglycosylase [Alphaproteobacteria bacterium]